jgi:predicted nucleic acid-binding protein
MDGYLDASVLLPQIAREPTTAVVDRLFRNWSDRLVVGEFAAAEVASAVSRLVRTGRLDAGDAMARLADFDAWRGIRTSPLDVDGADVRLASVYVRRFELMLRAPNALHVAICRRLGLTLVTLDRRLAAAALALGVAVTVPT